MDTVARDHPFADSQQTVQQQKKSQDPPSAQLFQFSAFEVSLPTFLVDRFYSSLSDSPPSLFPARDAGEKWYRRQAAESAMNAPRAFDSL
jgi:hypothetical protein